MGQLGGLAASTCAIQFGTPADFNSASRRSLGSYDVSRTRGHLRFIGSTFLTGFCVLEIGTNS